MSDQRTPPPWHAEIGNAAAIIRGPDGDPIAVMKLDTGDRLPPEQIANAHILGAAAELLDAVEALMLPLQAALDDCARIDPRDMPATLAKARAAIRKARAIGVAA